MSKRPATYTSYELDYAFNEDELKTVNRLFSSSEEALKTAANIADLRYNIQSMTIRIRKLEHD